MKNSRLLATVTVFTAVVAGLLAFQLATDRSPILGLDLKGGLSVIYATTEASTEDDLIVVRDLMRDQLEDFGIAEPDVRVEGENIIVDLPGVSDQAEAFEALQVSGIVELRPVLQCQSVVPASSTVPADSGPVETQPGSGDGGTTVPGSATPDAELSSVPPSTTSGGSGDESSAAGAGGGSRFPRVLGFAAAVPSTSSPDTATTVAEPAPTSAPTSEPTTGTTVPGSEGTVPSTAPVTAPAVFGPTVPPTTPPVDTTGQQTLQNLDGTEICLVGPSGGTGEVFERGSAEAAINTQTNGWVVNVALRGDGEGAWNTLAQQCFSAAATCPSSRLAIVLDGVIQSAPTVQTPDFQGNVQISGSFSEGEVRSLARVLNRGAFPVPIEQQRVETVSPTAGEDSLNAAIFAGLLGVGLTLLYMVAYYRKLAAVIVLGLVVWAAVVYVLSTWISRETNYAFTIAGATGIIVSIGVTVDTYIVFFERLKDEVRNGRTLRNAGPRAFVATWRTILAANTVAMLSAVVLFLLSVGSVKGFALYLGMTTLCDLLVFYFFTRPALYLLSDTRMFKGSSPRSIGIGTAIGGTR